MIRHVAGLFLFASLAVSACRDAPDADLSLLFGETPLRQIPGVTIGMEAKDLKRSRPAAKFSPFLGMHEDIPGYGVDYRFVAAVNDRAATDVDPTDRLAGVFVVRLFPSEGPAVDWWAEQVRGMTTARRKPDACVSFPTGGREARWYAGQMTLAIGEFPQMPNMVAGGPRVIFAVTPVKEMKQPAGAAPIACPTS